MSTLPPLTSEVTLDAAGTGVLMVGSTPYRVERHQSSAMTVVYLLHGPRGAEYGLIPTIGAQRGLPEGVRGHVIVQAARDRSYHPPRWSHGLTWLVIGDRLGYVR